VLALRYLQKQDAASPRLPLHHGKSKDSLRLPDLSGCGFEDVGGILVSPFAYMGDDLVEREHGECRTRHSNRSSIVLVCWVVLHGRLLSQWAGKLIATLGVTLCN